MLGKHYLKYFPREIVRLNSGLTMYESVFLSSDRSRGVIAGPHPKFTIIHKSSNFVFSGTHCYYTPTVKNYIEHLNTVRDTPLLGNKYSVDFTEDVIEDMKYCHPGFFKTPKDHGISSFFNGGIECSFGDPSGGMGLYGQSYVTYLLKRGPKCLKRFDSIEKSGTEISYRCMDCRNCRQCLQGAQIEEISMQEKMEQNLIEKNVSVDIDKKSASTNMPFTGAPDSR